MLTVDKTATLHTTPDKKVGGWGINILYGIVVCNDSYTLNKQQ